MDRVVIAGDDIEVVVLPEVGARIHRLRAFGHDLLRTPGDEREHVRDPFFWGAYVMAPWCNRITAGATQLGARQVAVGSNFHDGTAIHGQVYARPWDAVDDGVFEIRGGDDGWPWPYRAGLRVRIAGRAVQIDQTLTNDGGDPMPAGLGLHPWFRRPARIAIHGRTVDPDNTARHSQSEPTAGCFDLRTLGPVPHDLDATWSDLADPPVEMQWPDLGIGLTMRIEAPARFVALASPATLDAVAVEPQTHAPGGLARLLEEQAGGLAWLESGETLRLTTRIAVGTIEYTPAACSRPTRRSQALSTADRSCRRMSLTAPALS
jgi:aldose 1-epimerase